MRTEQKPSILPGGVSFFLLLALGFFATSLRSAAQTPPPQKENRFLFVINTSSNMRRYTNGIEQTVHELLASEMQGQMREGDTFGIWTYDDQLHTDFPMQVWSRSHADGIGSSISGYLAAQRYKNREHLEKILPVVRQTIAMSRALTVIFIYDGTETMQGSGFDKEINDLQNQFGRTLRNHYTPFVTLLAAANGKPFAFSVNNPDKISMLETAGLIQPPETNAAPVAPPEVVAATPPPAPVVAPAPLHHVEIVLTSPVKPATPTATAVEATNLPAAPSKSEPEVLSTAAAAQTAPLTAANNPVSLAPSAQTLASITPSNTAAPAPQSAASNVVAQAAPVDSTPTPPTAPKLSATGVSSPADHIALLVIAFALLVIAASLVLLVLRRSRGTPSLVTQSMNAQR